MADNEKEKDILREDENKREEKAETLFKDSIKFEDFVSEGKEEISKGELSPVSEEERQVDGSPIERQKKESEGVSIEEFLRLEDQYKETKELLLRVAADFENFKKRTAKEKEDLVKYANESLLKELLDVADNLELTLLHSQNASVKSEDIVKGFEITVKGFMEVLKRFGVTQIEIKDNLFDPNFHEAVASVESKDIPAGHIVKIERKGYMLRDRLLRPALVLVSSGTVGLSQKDKKVEDRPIDQVCIAEPEPDKN